MKRNIVFYIMFLLLLLAILVMFLPRAVGARGEGIPSPYSSFYYTDKLENEWICFYKKQGTGFNSVGLDCERLNPCPCEISECNSEFSLEPTVSPTAERPVSSETPEPTKTDMPKCNCGAGNDGEGCDPNPNCEKKKKHDE